MLLISLSLLLLLLLSSSLSSSEEEEEEEGRTIPNITDRRPITLLFLKDIPLKPPAAPIKTCTIARLTGTTPGHRRGNIALRGRQPRPNYSSHDQTPQSYPLSSTPGQLSHRSQRESDPSTSCESVFGDARVPVDRDGRSHGCQSRARHGLQGQPVRP